MTKTEEVRELLKKHDWENEEQKKVIMEMMMKLPMRDIPDLFNEIPQGRRAQWYFELTSFGAGRMKR